MADEVLEYIEQVSDYNIIKELNGDVLIFEDYSSFIPPSGGGSGFTWSSLVGRPAWLTGTTLYIFESGHTHSQYLLANAFFIYSGVTIPNTYYNKVEINLYTGDTKIYIDQKINGLLTNNELGAIKYSDNPSSANTFVTLSGVIPLITGTTIPDLYYNKIQINYYTGTTAPNTYETILNFNQYTGVTAPNTYLSIGNFNIYSGTTIPNIYSKISDINILTGTTLPNTYETILNFNQYTGTTAPNTYETINNINVLTGTTLPNTYETILNFNSYTGNTNIRICNIEDQYVTGATNGLTKFDRHNVCLGGTLNSNVDIDGGNFSLNIGSIDSYLSCLYTYSKNETNINAACVNIFSSGATFSDISAVNKQGIKYAADYSLTYDDRSLVDKRYVDTIATGLQVHAAALVATTGNTSLSGLTTIDGIVITGGTRVLVKNQLIAWQNGIYNANVNNWIRSSDYDFSTLGDISNGDLVPVITGSTNKSTLWVLTTLNPIVSGDSLTFSQFSEPVKIAAGSGIDIGTVGGIKTICVNLANNSGLCLTPTQLEVNPTIAGSGLTYNSGVLNINVSQIPIIGSAVPVKFSTGCGLAIDSSDVQVCANNGLSVNGKTIVLGGNLTGNTKIDGNYILTLNNNIINLTGNTSVNIKTPVITLQTSPPSGLNTDNVLVWNTADKCVKIINGSAFGLVTGATNGLYLANKKIGLGGLLTGNTTVGGGNYNLTLNNNIINLTGNTSVNIKTPEIKLLSTPATGLNTDNVLVWNTADKCVKIINGSAFGLVTGATNGLYLANKKIGLGGTLTGNTTINLGNKSLYFTSGTTNLLTLSNSCIGVRTTNPLYNFHISGSTYANCNYSTLYSGATITASSCINTPKVYASTCVCTSVNCSTTCDSSPIICGTACVTAPIVCSTNCFVGTNLIGVEDRVVYANSNGVLSASLTTVFGKVTDANTIANLTCDTNWNTSNTYCGTAVTGSSEGQYYLSGAYRYDAYSDNCFYRTFMPNSPTGATNGLYLANRKIGLGGALTGNTTVNLATYTLNLTGGKVCTTCLYSPYISGCTITASGTLTSPIICANSCINTPKLFASCCVCSPYVTGGTFAASTLCGTDNRMVIANSTGILCAPTTVIVGKISDGTVISQLTCTSNWSPTAVYTGSTISNTFEGQYLCDANYFFFLYSDNSPLRLLRG